MRRWMPASASSSILASSETVARPIRISPGTSSSNATSREAALLGPMGDKPVGWVASDDIAAVAAKVLAEGPERHAGKNYYLSTDVLNGMEVAGVLSRATDRPIQALVMTPDDLALGVASGQVVMPGNIEANYA